MTIIKSFSVGNGDMFAIRHASDNFTMIDCFLNDENKNKILNEIKILSKGKTIQRFISTHPDNDHIGGLDILDDEMEFLNFYCVKNQAMKENINNDENFKRSFKKYCELRDSNKAFYIYQGCVRKWMNSSDDERGGSGINILYPAINSQYFKQALDIAKYGGSPNNISPIIQYSNGYFNFLWFGDLETDFMGKIENEVLYKLPNYKNTNIIFAPHHGRESGKMPHSWLKHLNPYLIIIGEAPSKYLNYYQGFNTITQNSAGDIIFCIDNKQIDIYVSKQGYSTKIDNKVFCAQEDSGILIKNNSFYLGYHLFTISQQ